LARSESDAEQDAGALSLMSWPDRYMKVPFVDGGRSMSGADCYGLVRLVMERECSILLPSYGEISARDLAKIAVSMEADASSEAWVSAEQPREFDVAVMRWFARPQTGHVGIMIDSRRVLHTEERTGSPVIVPLTHYSIKGRVKYFRRHRELVSEHA
jgi:cell wall-associated NlpC family hydrolase